MARLLPDPPSRSGAILTRRELDAALRVLEALRRPQPASVTLSWDNDMQDALGGLQRARYVETHAAYGGSAPRKVSAPFRTDKLVTSGLGVEYLESIKAAQRESGRHHATRPRGRKKSSAQLDREIAAALGNKKRSSHATRTQTPYRIKLTPSELRAVEFARGRYAWPDMLSAHAAEDGSIVFTESEMWQWTDDVDADTEGGHSPFPLAAEAFAEKLQRFYEERT
jgi:hypothetical protein